MSTDRHSGINMHKLSFGGGFMGLLFSVGSALIFVLGFPTLWYFVAFAFVLGVGIAIVLRIVSDRRPEHNKPLSILSIAEKTKAQDSARPDRPENLLQALPKPLSA
jgi:hypothetical protein